MKYRKTKLMSLGLAVVGSMALAGGQNVFADNSYNIVYEGGEDLSRVVKDGASLSDLQPLIHASQDELRVKVSGKDWKTDGWTTSVINGNQQCIGVDYLKVTGNAEFSNTYIDEIQINSSGSTVLNGKYIERVGIERVELDNMPALEGKSVAVIAQPRSAGIMLGPIYTDGTCTTKRSDIFDPTGLEDTPGKGKVFIETKIQLYENKDGKVDTDRVFSSDKLYFGFTDIDRAQSFRILNENSVLTGDNMFSPDLNNLQPDSDKYSSLNKFKLIGNYIYSEYPPFNIDGNSRIFVKIDPQDQRTGLRVVFGFGANAGTPTMFYGKAYKVTYKSDPYGAITGIKNEDVLSGENPSGTTEDASEHYETEYWIADKKVKLKDGTEIEQGKYLTTEQIKNVVVDQDIEFTVYHKTFVIEYKSDEYGKITGTEEENRNSREHPGGSTQEPDEDYYFSHWVCDKTVVLTDGTEIAAGSPITDEQIKQVKVTQNLVFTAIHKAKPNTPNTGSFTKDGDNVAPIIGLMVAALASTGFVGYFVRNRKKSIVKLD
ncbi:hypothetical protein IKF04_02670 [Candidatus Saccharibacteria bacterium]|nr:hypothetical protein [Candidatus Saccharibacteria bacterium]